MEVKGNPGAHAYKSMGTSQLLKVVNNANAFPTRYWSESKYEKWEDISADSLNRRCDVKPRACAKCLMACGRMTSIKEGRHAGLPKALFRKVGKAEHEINPDEVSYMLKEYYMLRGWNEEGIPP